MMLLVHAATTLGCRASGAALFIGLGSFALFSRRIADGFFRGSRDGHRRHSARLAHWTFFAWGALGAIGGLMVLLGVLHCA
jgi:hypothetical protein